MHILVDFKVILLSVLLISVIDFNLQAVTDLLVRQKQVTIGMPSICEETITRQVLNVVIITIFLYSYILLIYYFKLEQ